MRFSDACLLLTNLEDIELRDPPFINPKEKSAQIKKVTEYWFKSHRRTINALDTDNSVALISTFLPERRTDRVHSLQSTRLCRVLCRCLSLSAGRTKDLRAYEQPGYGDLGTCLERVLTSGGPPAHPPVELHEVDDLLQMLAGLSPFSGPEVARLPPGSSATRDKLLGNIFKRLQPTEAKWLVRLILKDFSPVRVNERDILRSYHFLIPDLLQFQNDFRAAIELLKGPLQEYPECPDPRSERLHRAGARALLRPVVGVKVGRPEFTKARSIEHCVKMLGGQKWALERKYDGEYCEIHIDLSKSLKVEECITIFSKSGKDSTADRIGIRKTLIDCLSLGKPDCKIKSKAIILGEFVAYSAAERQVLPFDQIRKHVLRSGRAIGTDNDSPIKSGEYLAIVFFDLLLLDDKIIMRRPVHERRMFLREIYKKTTGRAWSAEWKIVDFSEAKNARKRLTEQFAASIAERCEGLILKPCDVPYFPLGATQDDRVPSYIKLKKDYISDLGDEADFAVVGGSYNPQQASKSGIEGLRWTEFHLGCLMNKFDVLRFDARPRFKIVGTIQQDQCIPKPILQAANSIAKFTAKPYTPGQTTLNFDVEHDPAIRMQSAFDSPLVFEVLGSGFEKPSNCNYLMLRHGRVKKLHEDRSWKDCVSMQELQSQAYDARGSTGDSESQETRRWIEKLERKLRRKSDRRRSATPQLCTVTTSATVESTARSVNTSAMKSNSRSAGLDGTTLVANTGSPRKRPCEDATALTPCPVPKRVCTKITSLFPLQSHIASTNITKTTPVRPSPLSEITNNAARSTWSSPAVPTKAAKLASTRDSPACTDQNGAPSATCFDRCNSPDCPLHDAVFYLAPSLTSSTKTTHLLLQQDALIISTLAHWDRDSFSHAPLNTTVAESQAYGGRKKIVLINRRAEKWKEEFASVVVQIERLNGGRFRERVDFWDVDVLDLGAHVECHAWWADNRSFLGYVCFDESDGGGRTRFVPRRKGWTRAQSSLLGESKLEPVVVG